MSLRSLPDSARRRLHYRWENSNHPAVHLAQRASAFPRARGAFAQMATIPTGSGELTIGYTGIETGLRTILPLLRQLAGDSSDPGIRSAVRRGRVKVLAAELADAADIVLVGGLPASIRAADLPYPSIQAPFRIHLVRDIPADADALLAQVSKRDRYSFRKDLRAHAFDTEIIHDVTDLNTFYRDMHVPTMNRRHGADMLTESLVVARRDLLARGFLFFVRSNGERVAGALCTWDRPGSTVTTRLLGVPGGDERHYDSGAFKALYHLLSEWCRCNGVRHLDLFATQAWTAKGLFQWKRRLHPRAVLPPNRYRSQRIRMYVVRDRAPVRDFLVANPLLSIQDAGTGLAGTWFCDRTRAARRDIKVGLPGLAADRTVDLDDFLAPAHAYPRPPATANPRGDHA